MGPQQAPVNPVASNPPGGAIVQYWLKNPNQEVTVSILDGAGNLIRSFSSRQDSAVAADSVLREARRRSREDSLRAAGVAPDSIQRLMRQTTDPPVAAGGGGEEFAAGFRPTPPPRVTNRRGINSFAWDMRYPAPSAFRGMILWAAGVQGPMAPPGDYQVRVAVNGRTIGTERFRLIPDPRVKGVTMADYTEQFRFVRRVATRFGEANDAVKTVRYVQREVDDRRGKLSGESRTSFDQHADALRGTLTSVEDSIYQTKSRSGQDPLNYPIRINNKLGALMGVAGGSDGRPTAQTYEVFDLLSGYLDRELGRMRSAFTAHLTPMNAILRTNNLPEITPRAIDVPAPQPARLVP
jgi:hypothetical protein